MDINLDGFKREDYVSWWNKLDDTQRKGLIGDAYVDCGLKHCGVGQKDFFDLAGMNFEEMCADLGEYWGSLLQEIHFRLAGNMRKDGMVPSCETKFL